MLNRVNLETAIAAHSAGIQPVVSPELLSPPPTVLDLSAENTALCDAGDRLMEVLDEYVDTQLELHGVRVAIGQYNENRVIYRHSDLFDSEAAARSIHLGIDLFASTGTEIYSPLPATVHSIGFNDAIGDYGPTVILEHRLDGITFFTLYGHLASSSVSRLKEGQALTAGAQVATMGNRQENGGWSPHLHFQLIRDIGDWHGNYPGVASSSERDLWLNLCPDPITLLRGVKHKG
ncbi:MAG: peptidoglycan DD-metalloendopeptidase family protein [bacterium]|nr:peptidoglycan DD-metalloendopeptidase family protein [bacterium]